MYSTRSICDIFGCELEPLDSRVWGTEVFPAYSSKDTTIWGSIVYPSVSGSRLITRHGFWLPSKCCVCLATPLNYLPVRHAGPLRQLLAKMSCINTPKIPHCDSHSGQTFARFALDLHSPTNPMRGFFCLGMNRQFIQELLDEYMQGDMPPPWLFAPGLSPASSWGQGEEEVWMHKAWQPFWSPLSRDEKKAYLSRWQASPEWQEALLDG